jgi:Lysozyme inhibitor LprI
MAYSSMKFIVLAAFFLSVFPQTSWAQGTPCYFLSCQSSGPPSQQQPGPPPAATAGPTSAPVDSGPGFNCNFAKAQDEFAICRNAALSSLDKQLNLAFQDLQNSLQSTTAIRRLKNEQRAWLGQRSLCGNNETCLSSLYRSRMAQLQSWH